MNELIERAEKGLRVLERREASLKARVGWSVAHIRCILIPETFKAETMTSRPASRLGGVNTAGMDKLQARKLQMLVSQRKRLEEELLVLEDEILNAV